MIPLSPTLTALKKASASAGLSLMQPWLLNPYMDSGQMVLEPLTYIRGRSIPHQFMIVDEAQNLTPHEVKTVITRISEGSKIVLIGDPAQIDNPYVDSSSNGFNYVVSRFRAQAVAAHIELQKGERSELAELAANIL